jgi:hypothetical protein
MLAKQQVLVLVLDKGLDWNGLREAPQGNHNGFHYTFYRIHIFGFWVKMGWEDNHCDHRHRGRGDHMDLQEDGKLFQPASNLEGNDHLGHYKFHKRHMDLQKDGILTLLV